MKKIFYFFSISLCVLFAAMNVNAQNVNVNPGAGSYPTLKDAFDAINAGTHTGAVTVDIVGNTTEPLMAILNASGTGLASYTSVVIAPSGGARTITGSDTVTIKLAGADNVTIDGRIAGTGRNLSVLNTWTLVGGTAVWLSHGGYAATDSAGARLNVVRNCEIACGVAQNTATTVTNGVLVCGTTRTTAGRNNDSNQILENRIIKCRLGISLNGGVATSRTDGSVISGNIVGPASFGTDQIGLTGILVTFQTGCVISKNTVQFVGGTFAFTTAGADRCGIGVGTGSWSASSTTTTTGSNYTIMENIVHDVIEERTFSAAGIIVGVTLSGPKTNNLIANNVVYNVRANGTAGDQGVGIGSSGGPGDRFLYNSVSITGDVDPAGTTTATSSPIAVGIAKHTAAIADTAMLFKNNSTYVDATSNTTTLLKAAMVAPVSTFLWGTGGMNYNDYYIPTPGTNGNVTGVAGTGTVSSATLALWQAVYTPAQDAASIQADPLYLNISGNLQPSVGSPLLLAGNPDGTILTDILGVTRSLTTPTIGAYEDGAIPPTDVGISAAVLGTSPIQIISTGKGYDIVATVKNYGPTVTVVPVYYSVNGGTPVGPVNTVGPIATNGTENVLFSGGSAYIPLLVTDTLVKIWTALGTDLLFGNDTLTLDVNVQQKIAAYPYAESFGSPENWTVVIEKNVGSTALWGLGLCTNAEGTINDTAATSNCFNGSAGRWEILRSPEMDFTGLTNPMLNFYAAYRSFTAGEDDSLQVLVSTDGGVTFAYATTVYDKSRTSVPSLTTLPGASASFFPSASTQWRHETVSLSGLAGASNVVLGFRSKSDFGNRQWVDNVIVSNINSLCLDNVTLPGTYNCNAYVTLNFTAIPAPQETANQNFVYESMGSAANKAPESGTTFNNFNTQTGSTKFISTQSDNVNGGTAFIAQYTGVDPGQNIAINTTATTPSLLIFTPSNVYHDYWFNVTYNGNDSSGYATYDISVDLDGLVFPDPMDLYLVKRSDRLGQWVCLTTTFAGNKLIATGLTNFCDFGIAGDAPLPVELTSLTSLISGRDVTLNWSTASEINNSGFDIERSSEGSQWTKVGNVSGNGTTTSGHSYTYTDRNLASGKYNYRLKQIDFNGNFEYFNLNNEVNIGIPVKYDLSQNYPNPFNPSTKINYDIPVDGKVSIKLFDMSGREVATLVNEVKTAGYYSVNFNAVNLSSGVYFYRISAGEFTATKKMMLLK